MLYGFNPLENIPQALIGFFLILSSIGVIAFKNPVHASISFLSTLLLLATLYIDLNAEFIGIMQVLVYAGAILVIFMFVIILFQDAYAKIALSLPQTSKSLVYLSLVGFFASLALFLRSSKGLKENYDSLPIGFGSVQTLGKALYLDFFIPFEAVTFLFLVAVVGALYIGKKDVTH